MGFSKLGFIAAAASLAALATAGAASAKGCNGYVNQWQWGCAPWDNNNGPQYPHWQGSSAQRIQQQQQQMAAQRAAQAAAARQNLYSRNANGFITAGGGNVISAGGGNVISAGGGN